MSPEYEAQGREPMRFPRVSGDEPQSITEPTALLMFSPRERG